jgi:hypothetical protein
LELAKKCKKDIKYEIELTIKETEFATQLNSDKLNLEELDEYYDAMNDREEALSYAGIIIEEFELNKRKDYESSK